MPGGQIMKKYFIFPLLLVLAVGLSAPLAFAQTAGAVKGICKDLEGKPIAQAEVEWIGTETGHKYTLKTNNKGEYFSLGIVAGRYNVKLSKDGKELWHFNGVAKGLDETALDFDLKKEQANAAQGQGMTTPSQLLCYVRYKSRSAQRDELRCRLGQGPILCCDGRLAAGLAAIQHGRSRTSSLTKATMVATCRRGCCSPAKEQWVPSSWVVERAPTGGGTLTPVDVFIALADLLCRTRAHAGCARSDVVRPSASAARTRQPL